MEAFMAEFETTTRPVGDATGDPDKSFKLDRSEVEPGDSEGKERKDRDSRKRKNEA